MKPAISIMPALLLALFFTSHPAYSWECSVDLTGPTWVKIGRTIELTASGLPVGGYYSWSATPNLVPNGSTATLTGFKPTFSEYIRVTVGYTTPKGKSCTDTKWVYAHEGCEDKDGDGFNIGGETCGAVDCNDNDAAIFPGAPELCDNKDNNCNGQVDEELSWDLDGDGHYPPGSCRQPADDCNDDDAAIFPGAPEICDNKDNNCDGRIDENISLDLDGDGHYTPDSCSLPNDDCDDNDALVYPGTKEICDGKDNDCNGVVDDLCPALGVPLFKQCASPWKTDTYDHIASTICKRGCALTSAVMVLRYYGITTGIDGKEVNPRNLNEWLIKNGGYNKSGDMYFKSVSEYANKQVYFGDRIAGSDKELDDELCMGYPVILRVPGHFVVATSRICSGTDETWSINDPGRNITTLEGYGNAFLSMRKTRLR